MDKRLAKRHAREVARAKLHKKQSEPDVRTPEQIEAAKQASHFDPARDKNPAVAASQRRAMRTSIPSTGSTAKTSG